MRNTVSTNKWLLTLIVLTAIAGFFALSGCDKEMDRINTNPLALTELSDEFLFTTAVRETFGDFFRLRELELRIMSQYSHVFVMNNEMRETDKYNDFHVQDVYEIIFSNLYTGPVKYINEVLRLTSEGIFENETRHAIATVIAVVNYARITDAWGDIPYFEGGKGQLEILSPKYDEQEFIYMDMMDKLKNALETIQKASPSNAYPEADPVYENDLDRWARFANSLRLRLAMRIRFASPDEVAGIISECLSGPLMETDDHSFKLDFIESDNEELYNPWYTIGVYYRPKTSQKLITWLMETDDPRISIFAKPDRSGSYSGMPNGVDDLAFSQFDWGSYSSPGDFWFRKDNPMYLMSASEIYFLRAEAALFNLGEGDPEDLYRKGISLAMQQVGVSEDLIEAYLSGSPQASFSGSIENRFEQIGNQMWLSFGANFSEAWSNIRRTGYPEIPQRTDQILSKGVTDGFLPKRFKYPTNEYARNLHNLNEAISRQGPDKIDTPVWWDKIN